MTCRNVQLSLSAHLDGRLAEEERQRVVLHLARCRDCELVSEQLFQLSRGLRELPVLSPPQHLSARLAVLASRERARRLAHRNLSALVAYYGERLRMWADNLMRPVALPAAGGLLSALLLFGLLVPSILMHRFPGGRDVPIGLSTEAGIKSLAPFSFHDDDFMVEMMIDGRGQMVDYSIAAHPECPTPETELRRLIENNLLFTEFYPATTFGRPTLSKIVVTFRRSHINVKS
jgi:hypothetical protein